MLYNVHDVYFLHCTCKKYKYKVWDNIFLVVDTKGHAYWSDVPSRASSKYSITEDKLVKLVEYLINKIYIYTGT